MFTKSPQSIALSLGLLLTTSSIVTPILSPHQAVAQNRRFSDVNSNYWASEFIDSLVQQGVIAGFPDGTFKPDAPVTRAQFAAMLQNAMAKQKIRNSINFTDVSSNYWGRNAIAKAYEMGFLSGYPGGIFRPEQNIPREQVLVSLANGLNYSSGNNVNQILGYYNDDNSISSFARSPIAAATQKNLVVNYPNLNTLAPLRNATRGEVAAFLYQALVADGKLPSLNSPYIVAQGNTNPNNPRRDIRLAEGTRIAVKYAGNQRILLTKNETVPVTLIVTQNIVNNRKLIIPQNSLIQGELTGTNNGARFVARRLKLNNGNTYNISAQTPPILRNIQTVNRRNNFRQLLNNTALGTEAGAAIAVLSGNQFLAQKNLLVPRDRDKFVDAIPQFLNLKQIDLLELQPNTNINIALSRNLVMRDR